MKEFMDMAGIPMLISLVCAYYGVRVMITKDSSLIRGKNQAKPKNEEAYCRAAGKLILFFGAATLGMGILIFWNLYVALAEVIICVLILGVLWYKMNNKYGA